MKNYVIFLLFISSFLYGQKPVIETIKNDTIYITQSYSKISFKCYDCIDAFIVKEDRKHYLLNYDNECYKYLLFTEKYNTLELICENKTGTTSKKITVVYSEGSNEIETTNNSSNAGQINYTKPITTNTECSSTRCSATTKSGKRCGNYTTKCSGRCHLH